MPDKSIAAFFLLIGMVFWLFLVWIAFGDQFPERTKAERSYSVSVRCFCISGTGGTRRSDLIG